MKHIEKRPAGGWPAAAPDRGLTCAEAARRAAAGCANTPPQGLSKSAARIVADNLFTPFNFLFCALGACLAAVGAWSDLLFLGVIALNTLIGIVQELRVKRALEKVQVLQAEPVRTVRDGGEVLLDAAMLVEGDIIRLAAGNQVPADCEICGGAPEVNEALLTGEADAVAKGPGESLLSGSFIAAGSCTARLVRVGAACYAARLAREARVHKKHQSEMMRSLDKLVKAIGLCLVPLGLAMFFSSADGTAHRAALCGHQHGGGSGGHGARGAVPAYQRGAGGGGAHPGAQAHAGAGAFLHRELGPGGCAVPG